jgi:hypothetical protein
MGVYTCVHLALQPRGHLCVPHKDPTGTDMGRGSPYSPIQALPVTLASLGHIKAH